MHVSGVNCEIEKSRKPVNGLHATARLYTDGSSKQVGSRHIVGYGFAGRIGNLAISVGEPLDETLKDSAVAEGMAILRAIETCLSLRPSLRRIEILTDHEVISRALNARTTFPSLEGVLQAIYGAVDAAQACLVSRKVKGHSLEGEDGPGNALAHHLAMLGRIGDPVGIDMAYRRDWIDRMVAHDARLRYEPLPSWIDPRTVSELLGIPQETIVRLVANGHMVYDHYQGGIRRSSVEYIRRAILAHRRGEDVDRVMEPLAPIPRFREQSARLEAHAPELA